MTEDTKRGLKLGRAMVMFLLAYVAVTILGTALSMGIGAAGHYPETAEPMKNQAYLIAEQFLQVLNLLVWGVFSWLYFRRPSGMLTVRQEALRLGVFWLAVALPVDFVGFVLIKNPISLSPHDFYVVQFPWIYLIYVAVFMSPLCYVMLVDRRALA